jgi:two-component system sensor histidine kinase and response regulator WspE
MSPSEEMVEGDPLLELFRADLHSHCLALERGESPAETIEAAKAIRGAARILGYDAVAELAGGLYARLTSAIPAGLGDADRAAVADAVAKLKTLQSVDPRSWVPSSATVAAEAKPPEPERKPVAPPPAPREHRSQPAVDPSLIELFREEVRNHTAALAAGLLELERDPANPQRIEPVMRAAHSLKGACRIVGIDEAVELAHLMEDGFVAAQAGTLTLPPAAIDTLLKAGDILAALAETNPNDWLRNRGGEVESLKAAVTAINRGEVPAPVVAPTVVPAPIVVEAPTAVASAPPAEAVVRVTAQSLNRLMSLAGESLVQARWLQPFANSLTELKKIQDQIANHLESQDRSHGEATHALVARARQVLTDRIVEFDNHAGHAEDLNSRLYQEVIVSRMRPFADGAHGFPRLVRDTARILGKSARLEIVGQTTEVDRDILEKLEAPLTHILRNAVDHGLEPTEARIAANKPAEGLVKIDVHHRGGMLSITVSDDGAGIDLNRLRKKIAERGLSTPDMVGRMTEAELIEFLFLPGFSTAPQVSEVSGRGVGLDVVQETIRKVGGSVHITTALGRGTSFHLLLPLTLSVVRAVLVTIAGEPYAFPHNRIDRLLRVPRSSVQSLQHRQFITVNGVNVGLVLASQLLDLGTEAPDQDELAVVLISDTTGSYGLIVDRLRGEQDLVVRSLDPRLGKVPNISAAAILDDGMPVLIADVEELVRSMDQYIQTGTLRRCEAEAAAPKARKRVLVVDDSITVREVQKQILKNRGYDVETAVDGADGWNRVREGNFDLVISDVDMPRMTGLEFTKRIRDDQRLRDLPVVIVSYKDRSEDRLRGLEAGANHYLTKASFHDDSFVEVVLSLIGAP